MRRLAIAFIALAPLAILYVAGRPAIAHGLLALGYPSASAWFFGDPACRGVALYSAGRWREAADVFAAAPQNAYNRGNALAHAGRYAEAVVAYDDAIARDPDNEDAVANKELVAGLVEGGKASTKGGMANADATRQIHSRAASAESNATSTGSGLAGQNEASTTDSAPGGGSLPNAHASDAGAAKSEGGKATGEAGNAAGEGRTGGVMVDIAQLMQARDLRARRRLEFHAVLPTKEWLAGLPDDPGEFLKLQILAEQARRRATKPDNAGDDD
jgi:tetratricopeptide (TPR) repeat protein